MIVIAIIGVLAAAMFPQVNAYLSRARDMTKVLEVRDLNA